MRLPGDILDELLRCAIALAVAHSNIRWPVSKVISATDATPRMEGARRARVPASAARALYRAGEHSGGTCAWTGPALCCTRGRHRWLARRLCFSLPRLNVKSRRFPTGGALASFC